MMAATVARNSSQLSSSLSVQEKSSRNKRKFRAEPPLADLNKLVPAQTELFNYEYLGEKSKSLNKSDLENHASVCDLCSTLIGYTREELDMEEFQEVDWNDITEAQLEELVLNNLDSIFKTAIKKIASYGFTEEVATKAVLRSGLCYGCKDTVSNIVDNTLTLLRNEAEVDSSSRDQIFDDLQQLEKYILAEMVCVLREVRPFFSTGDAMWCLLICDMNVSHACAMDADPLSSLGPLGKDDTTGSSSVNQLEPDSNSNSPASPSMTEFNAPKPDKPNPLSPYPQSASQRELPSVAGIPNLPSGRFSASRNMYGKKSSPNPGREYPFSSFDHVVGESSSTASQSNLPEEKSVGGKKGYSGTSRRESILRQKSVHFEKSYRAHGSKGGLRTAKLNGLGSLILDKKCKSISDSTGINLKSASIKLSKAIGVDVARADGSPDISFSAGTSASSICSQKTVNTPSPLHVANSELSLSLPSKSSTGANTRPNCSKEIANYGSYLGIPSDKMGGKWVPQDKKDEMLLKLVPRVHDLQSQLQEWTEWAQQKVMQAARRLSKDKAELQSLKQEKEEVTRLRKERKTLEDSTLKKISEMENALAKASGQVDRANASVLALEAEHIRLRLEMEAAKLRALESAASCQEVSSREMKTIKKLQSWEGQKILLQEELATEKRKLSQLQQQLDQAKEYQDQLEARRRQEEKMKDEALAQVDSERKERAQLEVSAKSKEDTIRFKTESDLQRYRDEFQRLENQISQLRLKTDSSKIAALRWSINGSYSSRHPDEKNSHTLTNCIAHNISKMMELQDSGYGDVQRERECVMCLTDEMSVVFLPCAHQVVCSKCSELHEKQGMKDCPSCRTPIEQRICVRFGDS